MGNHEEILFLYENDYYNNDDLISMGGAWWINLSYKIKDKILKKYSQLPIGIEVETTSGLVGIIHAECPHADWNQLSNALTGMNGSKLKSTCLWSTMSPLRDDIIKGVKAVIVGHMTQSDYLIKGNVHLIDTGAVYPEGCFTILELETLFPVHSFE